MFWIVATVLSSRFRPRDWTVGDVHTVYKITRRGVDGDEAQAGVGFLQPLDQLRDRLRLGPLLAAVGPCDGEHDHQGGHGSSSQEIAFHDYYPVQETEPGRTPNSLGEDETGEDT
jgi:hypothetical protein